MIRDVTLKDAQDLVSIYNYYIRISSATFEEDEISEVEMRSRIERIHFQQKFPYLVYESNGEILGYAYASTFRERKAYRYTVESTVYVEPSNFGNGIGKRLYAELIKQLQEKNYHSVIGVITLPNDASIELHEKFGFRKAGHFKQVGYKFNQWMDVGFWELLLHDIKSDSV